MSQEHGLQRVSASTNHDEIDTKKFKSVLDRIKLEKIPALASTVRQKAQAQDSLSSPNVLSSCRIIGDLLAGSYHISFRLRFGDGVEWILKIPANGHPRCWDSLAAKALRSEALTMRMIKSQTTILVPTVYAFDQSTENEIGCPYILMDFLQGKSLDRAWFDPECSLAKIERVRARSLQTIAATIAQLNRYCYDQGGALIFDEDDETVVGFEGAKFVDNLAILSHWDDVRQGLEEPSEDDIFCKKGTFSDSESALFFMQRRRKPEDRRSIHNKGLEISIRYFTQWVRAQLTEQEKPFVLAHPDFDFQNILVEDDGTVCGIIDWDGVATVPHSVGCLRYPLWLTRDWDAHYTDPSGEDYADIDHDQNTPEELRCYRAMYAQFIEAALADSNMNSESGQKLTDVTRLSLISTTLLAADTQAMHEYDFVDKVYREIENLVGDLPNLQEVRRTAIPTPRVLKRPSTKKAKT